MAEEAWDREEQEELLRLLPREVLAVSLGRWWLEVIDVRRRRLTLLS